MIETNTTGQTSNVAAEPKAKDLRKKYGIHKTALVVSAAAVAFRRDMNFDEQFKSGPNKVVTHSWIVIDPNLTAKDKDGRPIAGTLVRANTYNGGLGERVDYLNPANIGPIPGFQVDGEGKQVLDGDGNPVPTKDRRKALKNYSPIALSEVPFITVAEEAKGEGDKDEEQEESDEDTSDDAADEGSESEEV